MNKVYTKAFQERDIRPLEADAEKMLAYQMDREWLLKRKKEFVKVACPACASAQAKIYYEKLGFVYVECRDCATVYVNPRPTAGLLREFYRNSKAYEFWNRNIFPAYEASRVARICRPRIKEILSLCREHHVQRRNFVEVGPGFGTFSKEMQSTGFFKRVIVIEPGSALAESCRAKGLTVIEASVETAGSLKAVDVVVTFEVLEHLFSPFDFVKGCAKILSPNGLLVLTCPNVRGFDFTAAGKENAPFDHEHINYFHPAAMAVLLERCGLEVVNISTPGVLDVDLIRTAVLKGGICLEGRPFLKDLLLDHWNEKTAVEFQEFLAENGLSGHMWAVARKKRK